MFTDQEVSIKEIGQVVPKLSDLGIRSVASYLQMKPAVLNALKDKNLLEVVLEEISRRHPDELCTLRSHDVDPVGIPKGCSAVEVNEFLDTHSEFTGGIEHPFITTVYKKPIETDIEMLQNDSFRVNYTAIINVLMDKVTQRIDLLRLLCSNRSMVSLDKTFIEKSKLSDFDNGFEKFEENRMDIIEKIRRSLAVVSARKANVLDLKHISNTAQILLSKDLRDYLDESRKIALDLYELPAELPWGFGGEREDDDYSIDLFKLPKSWKRTAVLDTTVYELWNRMTREVTKIEGLKLFDADTILKAHIGVSRILQPIKNTDSIVAKKKTV